MDFGWPQERWVNHVASEACSHGSATRRRKSRTSLGNSGSSRGAEGKVLRLVRCVVNWCHISNTKQLPPETGNLVDILEHAFCTLL